MMLEEFEAMTGIFPDSVLYNAIEAEYMDYPGDKKAFCEAYKTNCDGIAEKIQRAANTAKFNDDAAAGRAFRKQSEEIEALRAELARKEAKIEKLEGWQHIGPQSKMNSEEYSRLASGEKILTDAEAIEIVQNEFGFAAENIRILRSIETYSKSREGYQRKDGEEERGPIYSVSDYNYIRFDVKTCWGVMFWEMVNGSLHKYLK